MKFTKLGLALGAVLAVAPQAVHAQVHGNFQWVGTGTSFVATYKTSNNTNISVYGGGPYQAKFNIGGTANWYPPHGTGTAFGPAVDIFCVDFTHHAQSAYGAWFTKLDGTPLAKTRSTNLTSYLKAAWLITKMQTYGTTTQSDKDARADIHAAIWYMMAGSPISVLHGSTYTATGLNYWIGQANLSTNWSTVNGKEWTVVTDDCVVNGHTNGLGFNTTDNCSQEFLTRNVVPEPATMILLGTGLLATLAMTGVLRRPEA